MLELKIWYKMISQETTFQRKFQGKRGQKENQVGLVLHVMVHGLISKTKYYLNVVQEYGVQLVKKFYVQHLASRFFSIIVSQHYKNILLNLRFPV